MKYFSKANLSADLSASLVVFLVALPLCLGIAVASGAPPLSGLIAGIIGGIVVGALSGSHISVSGPAAGLTVIVLTAQKDLGSFELFIAAVVVAGLFQIILGVIKAGIIGYYFPNSVIKGMLAAIGLILILKQIPHALGWDKDVMGDENFIQPDQQNTFSEIWLALQYPSTGAIIISVIALGVILLFDKPFIKRIKGLGSIPGALVAVFAGLAINQLYGIIMPEWKLEGEHLVNIPLASSTSEWVGLLRFPDFSMLQSSVFWMVAVTLAIVGSIETLLSIEAADKLDEKKRITPPSKELVAQGVGNVVSGLIGGLPITAVIVRSSANVAAGAKTKMSAIFHGILLLVLTVTIPHWLNLIPLACLASVLFVVGFKLAKPALFKSMFTKGWDQFLPFVITIIAILVSDLLKGIAVGMVVGLVYVVKTNFHRSVRITEFKGKYLLRLQKDVSFLNKAILMRELAKVPDGATILIDVSRAQFIDADIQEVLNNFIASASDREIKLTLEGFKLASENE